MKRLTFIILAIIITNLFGIDQYSSRETISVVDHNTAAKDTSWYSYYPDMYFLWQIEEERSTLIKADDFGLEYPVNLHGLSTYLFDSGYTFSYKIYDNDGSTLLWNSSEMISISNFNDVLLGTPMILTNDFYISIVPDENGMPRQVSSNIVGTSHSYIDSSGSWFPFYNLDERYEWVTQVSLSPFEDADTYPPIVRSLTGNDNFMDADANLELIVQDVNNVISPISAEYTIDGGTTWVPFSMSSVKSNYLFLGIIPGQIDGTVGSVKFYLEDDLSNGEWSEEYQLTWSKDKLLLVEGFEGITFPPENWTIQIVDSTGIGFTRIDADYYANGIHSGLYSALHSYGTEVGFNDDWLITHSLTLPSTGSVILSFWQLGYYLEYVTTGKHEIGISTDRVSWDIIYTGYPPLGEGGGGDEWGNVTLSLQAYAGQDVYIGFHYVGNYEDQWYIDDVELFVDHEGPVVNSISSNEALEPNIGAFVNNDMNINISASDRSGVASITGHYSFDGGATYTDLIFSRSKLAEELWAGTIPALTLETAGTIDLSLVDNSGNITNSDQYDIYFVADNEVVEIEKFKYESPVFVNDSMNISVTFRDESAIDSCKAFYSKDNWVSQTEISMFASKYHSYTYTGNIPAETAETFGKVKFTITDALNNTMISEEYEVKWLDGSVVFFDDLDTNHIFADWYYIGGNWGYNTTSYYSPVKSLSDSPNGSYYNNTINFVQSKEFDLSAFLSGKMYFWASIDLEESFDFFYVEATIDSGATWIELASFTGYHPDWEYYSVDIGAVVSYPSVKFKFTVAADEYTNGEGVDIDDIKIAAYAKDYSSPLISYEGPEDLVIGTVDYNFDVVLVDLSNISEVKVVYTVDNGIEQDSYSDVDTSIGGIYTMTIPAVQPGAKINYKIVATDSSLFLNSSETGTYEVYSGIYLKYENGEQFADFYDMIGNSSQATAYAIAKRMTMGPMDDKGHYRADLLGITIGNYSVSDTASDPMNIHVWADAGGFPGDDIITPIYYEQSSSIEDPYALTIIDLRPYSAELSALEGDIFVGFTSDGDGTNILYEVADNHIGEPGYVQHKRSWLGNGNEMGISWALDEEDVYHISGIIGDYTLVDVPLAPLNLTGRGGEGNIILNWSEGIDDDIDHYNIYRGDSESFILGTPIGSVLFTEGTTYVDIDPTGGDADGYFYYKITAVDVDSNESEASNEVKVNPSGIEEYLPLVTDLHQNYPNPFNPDTKINFTLAQTGKVKLLVYNAKGAVVSRLIDSELTRGFHSINFNGSKFVSGVYYCVLSANKETFMNKMVLLK